MHVALLDGEDTADVFIFLERLVRVLLELVVARIPGWGRAWDRLLGPLVRLGLLAVRLEHPLDLCLERVLLVAGAPHELVSHLALGSVEVDLLLLALGDAELAPTHAAAGVAILTLQ
eukprot:6150169-Pyramimonas_sp.AAC.1